MARIFITGSADGLGLLAAKALIEMGHRVVIHARNAERAKQASAELPAAEDALTGDLSSIEETKALATKANALGEFDSVIHNAGVYRTAANKISADGLPVILAVNSLAPYILTCLMNKPKRLIYLSSGMHHQGNPALDHLPVAANSGKSQVTYSDTKLHDVILAMAVARRWTDVYSNAVDPGWVPTKMGGTGAPDSLEEGYQTQVWLAVSDDIEATKSGKYFHHKRQDHYLPVANNEAVQQKFITLCEQITGVNLAG